MCFENRSSRCNDSISSNTENAQPSVSENGRNNSQRNQIIESVIRIDRIQREAEINTSSCITCDKSLAANSYNTIPIILTLESGRVLEGFIGASSCDTKVFRVESVQGSRYATLRLLKAKSKKSFCPTNYTLIADLEEVAAIQCLNPTNINTCCN